MFLRIKNINPDVNITFDKDKYPLTVVFHHTNLYSSSMYLHSNAKEIFLLLKKEYIRALNNLKVDQRAKDILLIQTFMDSLSAEQLEMYKKIQYISTMPYA